MTTLVAAICIILAAIVGYTLGILAGGALLLWGFLRALKANRLEIKQDGSIGPIIDYDQLWANIVWTERDL